ncbi:AraC family transcriptional regulator [Symbiobacterium terraclitae]|uniref:AraC family transcriptional regulator n=1 Tax=Symbiobacterium terraclitae TaxID=557451 RepID=A0ABS4JTR8_9FIRM|nr:AraC family transcriptional regulator [Symbiobacterium terraclitae]
MNPLHDLNAALAYIEAHLHEDVDVRAAARVAGCSEYHFRRMFAALAGMPLSAYIRRRRLTLAAQDLATGARVTDVALKYGYESPDAFARAFHAEHGIPPSEAKQPGQALRAFSRMTFQLTIQGGTEMHYRIVEKDAFRIVGIMRRVRLQYKGVNPEIAAMWKELGIEGIRQLKALSNVEPVGILQASLNFAEGRQEGGSLDQWIGAATDRPCPPGFQVLEVPALTWAVFESVGPFPQALQDTWARIYSEWFPSSGYEAAPGPEILWNESDDTSSPTFRSEIWIPVRR